MSARALFASLLLAGVAVAQEVAQSGPIVYVTAIELVTEVRDKDGKVPRDLKPEDLTLLEDGVERKVLDIEYLDQAKQEETAAALPYMRSRNDWEIVVYFDTLFSSTLSLRKASDSLAARAQELAAMGTVEVVVGDLQTSLTLPATRDVQAIKRGFRQAVSRGAKDFLTVNRRRFLIEHDNRAGAPLKQTRAASPVGDVLATPAPLLRLDQVRPYIMQEIEMAQRFRRNLLEWMAKYPRQQQPRLLLLISGGFEYDPVEFYFGYAAGSPDAQKAETEFSQFDLGSPMSAMARALAATSWTMISMDAPAGAGDQWIDDGGRSGIGRVRNLRVDHPNQGATFTGSRTRAPLLALADASGGSVIQRANLDEALANLGQRVKITYQVSRAPDGKPRRVEVRSKRPEFVVRTAQWASEATPDDIAAARVVQMLRGGEPSLDLPTTLAVEWKSGTSPQRSGTIVVSSTLPKGPAAMPSKRASFRVTILAHQQAQQPMLIHRIVNDYDLASGTFRYTAPITAPASKLDLVVAVEELTTGVWGGARTAVE